MVELTSMYILVARKPKSVAKAAERVSPIEPSYTLIVSLLHQTSQGEGKDGTRVAGMSCVATHSDVFNRFVKDRMSEHLSSTFRPLLKSPGSQGH